MVGVKKSIERCNRTVGRAFLIAERHERTKHNPGSGPADQRPIRFSQAPTLPLSPAVFNTAGVFLCADSGAIARFEKSPSNLISSSWRLGLLGFLAQTFAPSGQEGQDAKELNRAEPFSVSEHPLYLFTLALLGDGRATACSTSMSAHEGYSRSKRISAA